MAQRRGHQGGRRSARGRSRPQPDRRSGGQPAARRRGPGPRAARTAQPGAGNLSPDVVAEIRATARGPSAAEAISLLEEAVGDLQRNRPQPASRAASRAKALAPRSGAVREVLGLALYRAGRFREALRELQAYRRITGRVDQNHLVADSHRALGSPEKAPPLVQEALAARIPAEVRAEAAVVGAAALADLGRYEEALSLLRRFRTSSDVARPHDLRVWYVAGDVLERAGRKREAAREFRRIVEHDPDAFDAADRLAALS
jgi:tetratricopeptide (TPR) repeat protein